MSRICACVSLHAFLPSLALTDFLISRLHQLIVIHTPGTQQARGHSRVPVIRAHRTSAKTAASQPSPSLLPSSSLPSSYKQSAAPHTAVNIVDEAGDRREPDQSSTAAAASASASGRATHIEELCEGQQRSMPVDLDTEAWLNPDDVIGSLLVKELIMVRVGRLAVLLRSVSQGGVQAFCCQSFSLSCSQSLA